MAFEWASVRGPWAEIHRGDSSDNEVVLAPGWSVRRWGVTRFEGSGANDLPDELEARVDVSTSRDRVRVAVTKLTIGNGVDRVEPAALRSVASILNDIAWRGLFVHASGGTGRGVAEGEGGAAFPAFVSALKAAARGPAASQFEREDEVLRRWETQYQPSGQRQWQAAEDMGLEYSTFRTYLAHARARRSRP